MAESRDCNLIRSIRMSGDLFVFVYLFQTFCKYVINLIYFLILFTTSEIEEEKEELVENKIINEKIEEKFISKSNLLLNNVNGSKPPHQDYNLLAPKPYRKSLPSSVSTSTLTSSSNQVIN